MAIGISEYLSAFERPLVNMHTHKVGMLPSILINTAGILSPKLLLVVPLVIRNTLAHSVVAEYAKNSNSTSNSSDNSGKVVMRLFFVAVKASALIYGQVSMMKMR